MFTGLIRTIGTITRIERAGDLLLEITPDDAAFPLSLGASIACHGICLTVTQVSGSRFQVSEEPVLEPGTRNLKPSFTVALSAETLACTTAAHWQVGTRMNLEPSLAVGDPLGGHFVSGHVDGIATATAKTISGDSVVWEFTAPPELMSFIARKGSVALDGVSLTVNAVGVMSDGGEARSVAPSPLRGGLGRGASDNLPYMDSPPPNPPREGEGFPMATPRSTFTVNIIEHTAKHTSFGALAVGDSLNLEVDLLARYVARMMETRQ